MCNHQYHKSITITIVHIKQKCGLAKWLTKLVCKRMQKIFHSLKGKLVIRWYLLAYQSLLSQMSYYKRKLLFWIDNLFKNSTQLQLRYQYIGLMSLGRKQHRNFIRIFKRNFLNTTFRILTTQIILKNKGRRMLHLHKLPMLVKSGYKHMANYISCPCQLSLLHVNEGIKGGIQL